MSNEVDDLRVLAETLDPEELAALLDEIPDHLVDVLLSSLPEQHEAIPDTPLGHAMQTDPGFRDRDHLRYLSDRLAQAVRDVEGGRSRLLTISMPPRSGKSRLASTDFPAWVLRRHPDWKVGMISHESSFATSFGRSVRRALESHPEWGVPIAGDLRAASEWETTAGGGVLARGLNGSVTGRGFKVLILDDLVKGIVEANSENDREKVWSKWTGDLFTRLEGPYLVLAIGTRWHEDDFIGRLLSDKHEGDPEDWESIVFPAIAESDDVLGRTPGEPLISPLVEETTDEALTRWDTLRTSVGTYMWSALYQQRPSPASGTIFDGKWVKYWTEDPAIVKADTTGRVVLLNLDGADAPSQAYDSWDMTFKATSDSDYVVGQRWLRVGAYRVLLAQSRARRTFTESLREVRQWAGKKPRESDPDDTVIVQPRFTEKITGRLVEDKANGTAVLDTLKESVDLLIPINPTESKEARAQATAPFWEAGNVLLPHPDEPGNEWVRDDYLPEVLAFPRGANDDQVDATTQALNRMRDPGGAKISRPSGTVRRSTTLTARRISRGR